MTMPIYLRTLTSLILLQLTACADNPTVTTEQNRIKSPQSEPPMIIQQAGRSMQLVRILEGGVCKNELQGVKGGFLLYADTEDMKRIKAEKGAKAFPEFEQTITDFSLVTLQTVAQKINYALSLQKTKPTDMQSPLSEHFTTLFSEAIAAPIARFQRTTTLKIAIQPFAPELIFYQYNCEATQEAVEGAESNK